MADLEMQLAICKGTCEECGEVEWLYKKDGKGLFCGECLQAIEHKENNARGG